MDRRAYLLLTGVSAVLASALLVTPLWDLWYYRPLRSSPGAYVPVAVVAGPPAEARRAHVITASLAPAAAASRDSRPSPAMSPPIAPEPPGRHVPAPVAPAAERPVSQPPATTAAPERRRAERRPAPPIPLPERAMPDEPAPAPADVISNEDAEAAAAEMQPPHSGVTAYQFTSEPSVEPPDPAPVEDPADVDSPSSRVQAPPAGRDDPEDGPAGTALVRLLPGARDLLPGDVVVVTVHVADAVSMSSLPFHLTFDPNVLEFVDSQVATALTGSHEAILLASVNPNRPGDLAVGLSLVESSGLFTGSGALVHLRFRALAHGESEIAFARASLRGATSQPLNARFEPTSVRVQ